ncbi:MAG: hypothetical protein H6818_17935 [Phycisphaerales bacterium]|nr:hypothetical protein [Phycisphaerales bacterium]MCB9864839.1 hypothetical protein [Phycisphaerales bacterium]
MRWNKKKNRLLLAATAFLAGGTVLQSNCANVLYSLPICGTVLTFCTPFDQLNVLFPLLETPDFKTDPTCTIPLGCVSGGDGTFFEPGASPGGDLPNEPENDSGGGTGGGGGGGGGGI